ncbi:hypothetical protein ABZ816_21520 [Actinosynnema sp. NPDC047251]|uniref:Putative secreted protein n=1 Tax=Saccharothrix espanaensis (strain ATCC 51144 / DSM 44229 / JCM 9112 / NBRC 15066 / NRRL 15764) TaxID=1179773 RepID=K0KAG7_SACES|nr:hypothetical protein [Saccharothrix espanaensis]CCH33819.1 putative secreted protein [Saccharothrix espanaensis DSM 44229]
MNRRVLGVVALLVAAPLVFVGTFLPLYTQVWEFGDPASMTIEQTSWEVRSNNGQGVFGRQALYAVPMVVGALLMVLGALRVGVLWGRLTAFAGSVLLLGSTWAVAHYAFATYLTESPGNGLEITPTLGLGTSVLLAASVLAVVGGLLVQEWPPRAPRPEGPVVYQLDDDDTPPFGIPVAELPATSFADPGPQAGEPRGRTGP